MLKGGQELDVSTKPSVILVIGVNGVGKTTTIGKLSAKFVRDGKKVILAAADTFRAAAIDQLEIWAERSGADIIKQNEGSDPAAVVFDAISAAKARGADIIIADTAGRLHNKKNLMAELAKINRIIDRELPGSAKEVLLVLDATTGQNAVNQTKEFKNAAGITGIVLTKLDGTAKGGVVLAIKEELDVPVKFIGIGEQVDDLQPFDPEEFAKALFMDDESFEELENETEAQTDNSEEDNRPATADIWDKIDAEAEAERQAELALEIGQARDPHYWYFSFRDYAFDYLLAKCGEDLSPIQVCHPALEALIRHDEQYGTEYAKTLVCYLRNSQNTTNSANELFIHRTSFMRRMAQIEKIASFDLDDPDEVLHLLISARLLRL